MLTAPNITSYDIIVVNSSGGKDSQAMLDYVAQLAAAANVSDRIVVVHADLGRVEWQGTVELAQEQAEHYGFRFEKIARPQGDLLDHIEKRGMFPSSAARYCTSDHKRGQCAKVLTMLVRELDLDRPVRILNCLGFRREESSARAKKETMRRDQRATNGKRLVDEWLPILEWSVEDVWARIRRSGVRHHWAYDAGMPRLSCSFCVLADRKSLVLAAQLRPELAAEYAAVEKRIDHRFRNDLSMREIIDAGSAAQRAAA